MNLEGILSETVTAPYLSGRRPCLRKVVNPELPRLRHLRGA